MANAVQNLKNIICHDDIIRFIQCHIEKDSEYIFNHSTHTPEFILSILNYTFYDVEHARYLILNSHTETFYKYTFSTITKSLRSGYVNYKDIHSIEDLLSLLHHNEVNILKYLQYFAMQNIVDTITAMNPHIQGI